MSGIAAPFADHARRHGDKPALIFDSLVISWRELVATLDRLAAGLAARTASGDAIALVLPQSPALALLFLACARAGRQAQILDAGWPKTLRAEILDRLAPALIVSAEPQPRAAPAWRLDDCSDIESLLRGLPALTASVPLPPVDADALFYCGLTSGSTGLPRAYRRTHRSWLESFLADELEFGIGADDVVLAPGSLTHSLFVYALAHGLYRGASVILCARFRPFDVLRLARAHRASVIYSVPSQVQLLVEAATARGEKPLADLRWLLVTGAKWFARNDLGLRRLLPRARCVEFYGASETSFITLARDDDNVPPGSVGRAFAHVQVRIRDEDHRALAPNQSGLVFVQSPMLFHSYADGTPDDIIRNGDEISVGDVGYLNDDGFLFLTGRASRMIVTAGKNLFPEKVEAVLRAHPDIAEIAVIGIADALRGEKLVALFKPRAGHRVPTRRDLIGFARARLPLYKVPRHYAPIADWPMTHSGKSDLKTLTAMWQNGACEECR